MDIDFNKPNLVYLLMIVNRERQNGIFFNDMMDVISNTVQECRKNGVVVSGVSRATFYNYFKDIDHAFPAGYRLEGMHEAAFEFTQRFPKQTDKFYRQFSRAIFECVREFLIENQFLGQRSIEYAVSAVPNSLYFSLIGFLGKDQVEIKKDHSSFPGDYKVFRPSLSTPGKILCSAARIESMRDGSLRYLERMHWNNTSGWHTQILEGYIISVGDNTFLITKDSSTLLMQFSVLHSLRREKTVNGVSIVRMMAGSYSGASKSQTSGLFSTGIFFLRENFRSLTRYNVATWKIGHIGGFGLLNIDEVPDEVRSFMLE